MKIIAGIFEAYVGCNALISCFYHDWASSVEENKEHIEDISTSTNGDPPAKIQAICSSITNEFCFEDQFYVPRGIILDSDDVKRAIMR